MSIRKHIEDQSDQMKFIGGIITCLNRLENGINHVISSAFVDVNTEDQYKLYLIGRVLADEKIFGFEEKRQMFIRLVEETAYVIKSKNLDIQFDEEKYKKLAKEIQKVQEIRNDIAHKYILTNKEGFGEYYKAKTPCQLFKEQGEMKGSFLIEKLDLKKTQEDSIVLCDKWENLMVEMLEKFANVFNSSPSK
ncbi:MAG: hypothetical protein Q8Q90_03100 [bacterium]|nr:hypothetical protein [bacterium]